jgi:hypothetical protein
MQPSASFPAAKRRWPQQTPPPAAPPRSPSARARPAPPRPSRARAPPRPAPPRPAPGPENATRRAPQVQAWIRKAGAVVSRINIPPDFAEFFRSNPAGVYRNFKAPLELGAPGVEPHAVAIV